MKALHARGLVDKRDCGITWSWELRPEGKAYLAASGTSGCAMCDDLKSENAALREKVEVWEWFEECYEVMRLLAQIGPNRADAHEEAVISAFDALKRAVHADRE